MKYFDSIEHLQYLETNNFVLFAGPCVIENESMPMEIARSIKAIADELKIPFVFKASYRKANRTSLNSFTGIGDVKALNLLKEVRQELGIPVMTDVHLPEECALAAEYVDVIQIPAFLCRQTDLLVAAAKTNKFINIKKGQFLSAESMRFAVEKVKQSGNESVALTERGNSFGYQDLVVDFNNIPKMKNFDVPVIMDVTHSLQQPNQAHGVTGGQPEMIENIAKAAIACGVDGLFIETHPNPSLAKSDGANMLSLDQLSPLMKKLIPIRNCII